VRTEIPRITDPALRFLLLEFARLLTSAAATIKKVCAGADE
jgi:hypothetical protein